MGNKASKAASNAAKSATASSASSKIPKDPRNLYIKGEPVKAASATKSSSIMQDAADPSGQDMLSRNLASLGQVTIHDAQAHNATRYVPSTQASNVLQRRKELEESESDLNILSTTSTIRNRLATGSLTTLLDARKEIKSPAEYKRLCDDFNCDPSAVNRLTRHVTSPSLTLQRNEQQGKEDTYLARWVDPAPIREQTGRR